MLRKITLITVMVLLTALPTLAESVPPAPLPKGTTVAHVDASIPQNFTQFLGIWRGSDDKGGRFAFAVVNMNAKGEVACIYAWSVGEIGNTGPVYGIIKDGVLLVPSPYGPNNNARLEVRLNANTMDLAYIAGKNFEQHIPLKKSKS